MGAVETGKRVKSGGSVGRVKRTTSIGPGPVFGSLKVVSSADETAPTGVGIVKNDMRMGGAKRTWIKRRSEEEHNRGRLDVEEALLAQKLLMKLDLAPGF